MPFLCKYQNIFHDRLGRILEIKWTLLVIYTTAYICTHILTPTCYNFSSREPKTFLSSLNMYCLYFVFDRFLRLQITGAISTELSTRHPWVIFVQLKGHVLFQVKIKTTQAETKLPPENMTVTFSGESSCKNEIRMNLMWISCEIYSSASHTYCHVNLFSP